MSEDLNTKGLDALIMAFKEAPSVRVGILGNDHRSDGNSNATIGAKHEFGDSTMPIRSFLRVPLAEHMQEYMEASGAFDGVVVKQIIKQKSFIEFMQKVAVIAETIVLDGFASGGFGKWKPSNMTFKKNHQTLIESNQLRSSITSEVK